MTAKNYIPHFKFLRSRHIRLGRLGEKIACKLLKHKHFDILCRNYKSSDNHGEADIVARDGAILCFIEVKTRHKSQITEDGTVWLSHSQMERIKHAAKDYINKIKCDNVLCRFDLIEITMSGRLIKKINHWQNNFGI